MGMLMGVIIGGMPPRPILEVSALVMVEHSIVVVPIALFAALIGSALSPDPDKKKQKAPAPLDGVADAELDQPLSCGASLSCPLQTLPSPPASRTGRG